MIESFSASSSASGVPDVSCISLSVAELSGLLIEVVTSLCRSSFQPNDWRSVVDMYILPLQQRIDIDELSLTTRLAAITSLIGAHHAESFDLCIEWFAAFEEIKGPYWIVQEELLRHFVLFTMRSNLVDLSPMTRLSELLGTRLCTLFVEDKEMLRLMLPVKRELEMLLGEVVEGKTIEEKESLIDDFESRFPLSSFSVWFAKWALEKLCNSATKKSSCTTATQTDLPSPQPLTAPESACVTPPGHLSQMSMEEDQRLMDEEQTTQQSSPVALFDVVQTMTLKFVNP